MKSIIKSMLTMAVVAMGVVSCSKQEQEIIITENTQNPSSTWAVNFKANEIESRSVFGEPNGTKYPTLWTENDKTVKIYLNMDIAAESSSMEASEDGKTASFSATFAADKTADISSFTFYALTPSKAYVSNSADNMTWRVSIPITQTPLEGSVDETAQILYAYSEFFDSQPDDFSEVDLHFNHFTAYGNMTIKNLELGDAVMNSIDITSSTPITGRWDLAVADGTPSENSTSNSLSLLTSSTSDIWFAVAPVDVSNQTFKITVNTDKGTLSKTVTFPSGRSFKSGKIAKFSVDFDGVEIEKSVVYNLVTDVNKLTVGSKVIIAALNSAYAISSTQNNNNRAQTSVTKSEDGSKIIDPSDAVEIFTVGNGNIGGTHSFFATKTEGYIYAASAKSNHLKTEDNLSDNSSWKVSISADDGNASVVAQGANTRNTIRHNDAETNGSLFSCYASSSSQKDIAIYQLEGSDTGIAINPAEEEGETVVNESSADNPYSVEDVLALLEKLGSNEMADVYVKGIITQIDEISTKYGNATYLISDDESGSVTFKVYRGKSLEGNAFTSEDEIQEGDVVVVCGTIVNYKEEDGSITPEFKAGSKIISINGDGGDSGDDDTNAGYYVKVTSTSDLVSGQYLIVYETGSLALNGGLKDKLDAVGNTIVVTISDGKIAKGDAVDAASFTYDATAKTLKGAGGLYMGQTSDANGMQSNATTTYANTITIAGGDANIVSGGAYLRYNDANNQTRFRYYKSSSYSKQKAVQLYRLHN